MNSRRQFLVRTGLALGSAFFANHATFGVAPAEPSSSPDLNDWEEVRALFPLSRDLIHMAGFFLASHPTPVREAIERHRRGLDADPVGYWHEQEAKQEASVLQGAAEYLGVQPSEIALTDSTTMGLGLLYGGLTLKPGQEILSTVHDHYSTEVSLKLRAERTGTTLKQIALYETLNAVSSAELVDRLMRGITPRTRIVAVTWVHSSTGLKLPVRDMASALAKINADRDDSNRVMFCVDGVHALGVEQFNLAEVGCDFFIAGTHKWMFGPRGTGLVWGRSDAWPVADAIIPTFSGEAYDIWMKASPPRPLPQAVYMTPGGFHSFEHRWALDEAFKLHRAIGKARVTQRIHALNQQLKQGLAAMGHVTLHTPLSQDMSAGIVCFEVAGQKPEETVARLRDRGVVGSVTPYATRYARLAPSLLNSEKEVDKTLEVVRGLR